MELHNFTKFGIKNWSMVVIFCISTKIAILRASARYGSLKHGAKAVVTQSLALKLKFVLNKIGRAHV